jgi:hypothetical protein
MKCTPDETGRCTTCGDMLSVPNKATDADRIAALEAELAEARLARVPLLEVKIHAIGELIADNGCDCECDHDFESHDDDCERCLACRISAALDEKGGG